MEAMNGKFPMLIWDAEVPTQIKGRFGTMRDIFGRLWRLGFELSKIVMRNRVNVFQLNLDCVQVSTLGCS